MGCLRNWHRTDIKNSIGLVLESSMRSMTCYEIPQHNQIQILQVERRGIKHKIIIIIYRGDTSPPPFSLEGSIWCSKLHDYYLAYTNKFLELALVLTMGIHANGFRAYLMRPHYVLHNRSNDLPISYLITFKIII